MRKYDRLYLQHKNIDEDWHEKQQADILNWISNSNAHLLRIVVVNQEILEACIPVLWNYRFSLTDADFMGYRVLEIVVR